MRREQLTEVAWLIVRIAIATVMIYHGGQKLLGAWDGRGLEATLEGMSKRFPVWLVWLAIISEFFGGIGVLVGLFTRVAAFGIMCTMAVAAYGHFVNPEDPWTKVELPLAVALGSLALILNGAGKLSLDYAFFGKRSRAKGG